MAVLKPSTSPGVSLMVVVEEEEEEEEEVHRKWEPGETLSRLHSRLDQTSISQQGKTEERIPCHLSWIFFDELPGSILHQVLSPFSGEGNFL
jgi:hypothetical protein